MLKRYNKVIYIGILVIFFVSIIFSAIPAISHCGTWLPPPFALFTGLIFALFCGKPFAAFNKKMSKTLLQYSVVGLGFGMNIHESIASGSKGMFFTIVSVFGTLVLGWLIGRRFLKIEKNISYLISSGTAICGGSAIAAVAPIVKAKESEISIALGTVFILNAIALFIFPSIGNSLGLTQQQFGTWAAIAIHDTSSVVGAGAAYGEEALQIATTIKLTRALWIVPIAFITSFIFNSKNNKVSVPTFIILFVGAMLINTYLLENYEWGVTIGKGINLIARKMLTITLFIIGASLSVDVLKSVGFKPLLMGILLWIAISSISLCYICLF